MRHINEISSPLITINCTHNSHTLKAQRLETLGGKDVVKTVVNSPNFDSWTYRIERSHLNF